MNRYIAFLRAINVGGRNVKMDQIQDLFESMKFKNIETFIASGNVIFETNIESVNELQLKIERKLANALGYEVATFIRTDIEIARIAQYSPFDNEKMIQAVAYNIGFLKRLLNKDQKDGLNSFTSDIDDFHIHEKEIYWICKKKQSESDFNANKLEKKIKLPITFRSIKTINRLTAKYPPENI